MQKLSFTIQESRNEIQLFNYPIAKFSSYYSFQHATEHAVRSGLASGIFLTSFDIRDFFIAWMCILFTFWELSVNLLRA